MFDSLKETVKAFSFQSVLKGNIISSPGSRINNGGAKSNSPASNLISNRYLSTYYTRMQEINDYEINDLTKTILQIYMDYLTGYFSKSKELVTVDTKIEKAKGEDAQKAINKFFTELDLVGEIKMHLRDIIYHGAWCFRVEYDSENRKYRKLDLYNPHNVVTVYKGRSIYQYLVTSRDGKIMQVQPEAIIRLGRPDLFLINDINKEYTASSKEDTLIKDDLMIAGYPLYYDICGKVKEFLLKEQILSLLSIKDLIQPLLLLVRLDKNTSTDEGNKLALNIENMINKYSDISSILSSNFNISGLIDAMMNNIRVIPDYHSTMGDMNNIDLSKITNKIQEIEGVQEAKKEIILTSCSIPKSLYDGNSTKWDAIKSSQRLNSKVNGIVKNITEGVKDEAIKFYKDVTGYSLDPSAVTVNLFTKTDIDYNVAISNADIVNQLTQSIQNVLSSAQQTLFDSKLIDKKEFITYIKNQLKIVDQDVLSMITDESIDNCLNYLKQQEQQNNGSNIG